MSNHPQEGIIRMTSQALLGALLFLLVASFLALPCLTADAGLFSSVAGPQACQEHKLFKAQADPSKLLALPAESAARFLADLPVVLAASVLAAALLRAAFEPPRAPSRARSGMLPFATSDPPKLPAFAALRDA